MRIVVWTVLSAVAFVAGVVGVLAALGSFGILVYGLEYGWPSNGVWEPHGPSWTLWCVPTAVGGLGIFGLYQWGLSRLRLPEVDKQIAFVCGVFVVWFGCFVASILAGEYLASILIFVSGVFVVPFSGLAFAKDDTSADHEPPSVYDALPD